MQITNFFLFINGNAQALLDKGILIMNMKQNEWYLGLSNKYNASNLIFWSLHFRKQNGHSERTGTPEVKHTSAHTAAPLSVATSVVKNDQVTPGGATTPAAIVKSEIEHNQSTKNPSDRQESSGNTSMICWLFSQGSAYFICSIPVLFFFSMNINRKRVRAQTVTRVECNTSFCKSSYSLPFSSSIWNMSISDNSFKWFGPQLPFFHIWLCVCFFYVVGCEFFSGVE